MAKPARSKLPVSKLFPVSKLCPVSKNARRVAEVASGQRMADADVVKWWSGCDCREIPTKLAVMNQLVFEAWEIVHRLADSGVRFAGSTHDATLVIAGTAYAAWRISLGRRCRAHNQAYPVLVASGMNDGIEFAIWNKSGIPSMYADDYLDVVADSKDPIDRMTPMQALAQVWPRRYAAGVLRLAKVQTAKQAAVAAPGSVDLFWEHRPNIFTDGRHEIRRPKARAEARKPKAK